MGFRFVFCFCYIKTKRYIKEKVKKLLVKVVVKLLQLLLKVVFTLLIEQILPGIFIGSQVYLLLEYFWYIGVPIIKLIIRLSRPHGNFDDPSTQVGEVTEVEDNTIGVASNLKEGYVDVILLKQKHDKHDIVKGSLVYSTKLN